VTAAVALAAVAGLAGAVQAAVMGELGKRVGIVAAITFSAVVTLVFAAVALAVAERSSDGIVRVLREPPWLWVGGALSLFIIVTVTVAPPRIGIAATIGIIIAGNLAMGALIDHFGLFGSERIAVTWPRLAGMLLLGAGAALSLHR
jgi:bacterial/archaeal transporter family-2 protein